jgi:ParB-like chromosome segregation protein Spo0J
MEMTLSIPAVIQVPVRKIEFSLGNPRSKTEEDIQGLAASMGSAKHALIVNPPLLRRIKGDRYRVIAGERRVRAAALAGWQSIPCQIRDDLDAHGIHQVRVVENLHRRDLDPFDQATALKISWLVVNGDALGLQTEVESILAREQPQTHTLAALELLLEQHAFVSTHPAVSWDETLNQLGVELSPERRKKLMRVLAVDPKVQEKVRDLGLTEAALRSIGSLEIQEQNHLAREIQANPNLIRKVRRIARVVRAGSHSMADAIAEARGQVTPTDPPSGMQTDNQPIDERISDQVIRLLEAATTAQQALGDLHVLLGGQDLKKLPDAWRGYAEEALGIIRSL